LPRDRPFCIVVEPLYVRDEQIGFVLLEGEVSDGALHHHLREQLSSVLRRVQHEEELARLRTADAARARELEQAYRTLRENQERMLIQEKMASLGRLTAGRAHQMNTPLAAVRNALDELDHLVEEYRSSVGDPCVTPADHSEIAAEMDRTLRIAARAAERAAGFVQGIKFQTRDCAPHE